MTLTHGPVPNREDLLTATLQAQRARDEWLAAAISRLWHATVRRLHRNGPSVSAKSASA